LLCGQDGGARRADAVKASVKNMMPSSR
jgi:hypothetical protein